MKDSTDEVIYETPCILPIGDDASLTGLQIELVNFRMKPDFLIPGVGIDSCDDNALGYVPMSGSSQASAHVAGAVALLKQAHPTWTFITLKLN